MKLHHLLAGAGVMIGLSAPAFANQCPSLMQKFDQATSSKMTGTQATSKEMKTAMSLRQEAETLHKEGKHSESIEHLNRALKAASVQA